MKPIKTNVEGFVKDINTGVVLSSDKSFQAFKASRKRDASQAKIRKELDQLKQNVSDIKDNIAELKEIFLKVLNG